MQGLEPETPIETLGGLLGVDHQSDTSELHHHPLRKARLRSVGEPCPPRFHEQYRPRRGAYSEDRYRIGRHLATRGEILCAQCARCDRDETHDPLLIYRHVGYTNVMTELVLPRNVSVEVEIEGLVTGMKGIPNVCWIQDPDLNGHGTDASSRRSVPVAREQVTNVLGAFQVENDSRRHDDVGGKLLQRLEVLQECIFDASVPEFARSGGQSGQGEPWFPPTRAPISEL